MAMAQKEKKKRRNNDDVKLSLANREANSLLKAQQKKKKSISITEKCNRFNQISIISNGCEAKSRQQKKKKKKSDNTTKHMDIVYSQAMEILLKEEIIMEILSRLPVQSLFRFKCVLKSWKALITDPYFKRKHLNYAKNDLNSQKLIAKKCIDKDDMFNFFRSSLSSSFQVVEDEHKLDCPSNSKPVNCVIHCCCDGLVLLSVIDERNTHLLLWNPSTGESIELPYPLDELESSVWGLGYDETSDEYTIAAVSLKGMFKINILVFPLKYGGWKDFLDETSMSIIYKSFGCCVDFVAFVHGSFHWIAMLNCCTIISFSFSRYVLGEIPLLEQMWNTPDLKMDKHGVTVLKGMLCFYQIYVDFSCLNNPIGIFKLWVMKDYGVKESWMMSLSVEAGLYYIQPCMPIYMYPDGEVLIHSTRYVDDVAVFRTSRDPFKSFPRCRTLREGTVYTESLISPKSLI